MSRAAGELLLARLAGELETTEPQIFQAQLVVRESA
jgi:DNA-binding LacI/PurR family transcriptional regulator